MVIREMLKKEANTFILVGSAFGACFFGGGYYFSMKEKYEREVAILQLQVTHEREQRELHDDVMMQKLNHERDQQALSILHLRRQHEKLIKDTQVDIQKWIFDLVFHGDYELFQADVKKELIKQKPLSNTISDLKKKESTLREHIGQDSDSYVSINIKDTLGNILTSLSVSSQISVGDLKYLLEDHLYIPPLSPDIIL